MKTTLPASPAKKAAVLESLVTSPRTRKQLEKRGVVTTPEEQREVATLKALASDISSGLAKVKDSGSNEKRAAFNVAKCNLGKVNLELMLPSLRSLLLWANLCGFISIFPSCLVLLNIVKGRHSSRLKPMRIVHRPVMLPVCLRAMLRLLGMPMLLLPRIHHLNRPRRFWLRLCKLWRLLWRRNRLRYLAQPLRPCQTQANLCQPLACPVRWPLGAFPCCYLRKPPLLLLLEQALLHIPPPQELLLLKVGQLWLFPLLCRPFCPRTPRIHCPLPTWRPRRPRRAFHLLPRCPRPTFRPRLRFLCWTNPSLSVLPSPPFLRK